MISSMMICTMPSIIFEARAMDISLNGTGDEQRMRKAEALKNETAPQFVLLPHAAAYEAQHMVIRSDQRLQNCRRRHAQRVVMPHSTNWVMFTMMRGEAGVPQGGLLARTSQLTKS